MNDWLRPLTFFPDANGPGLPGIMGGPFPDDVLAICISGYGPRAPITLPDGSQTGSFHSGADFWAAEWAENPPPLLSLVDGICEFADYQFDVGNWCRIRDLSGGFAVDYYHMQDAPLVKVGDSVWMGQQVGTVGETGWSTTGDPNAPPGAANHLHLQIIDNASPADPIPYLRDAPSIPVRQEVNEVVEVEKKVNIAAIGLVYDLLRAASAVAGQKDGQFIGILPGAPVGYRDVVTRVKE